MKKFLPLVCLLIVGCTFPYFNIYYNAKTYYDQAYEAPLRDDGKPASNAIANYNKTITKCSRIMTDYPKSKWADDALFLLAKSLYYRANSYSQSEDKFKDLLTYYPESPFCGDAEIFIARCEYELGHTNTAYQSLQNLLLKPEYQEQYPEILIQLSDYYLREKDYSNAVLYLDRMINNYPKAEEYKTAFFQLGKTYFDAGEYARSDSIFTELLKSRVPRRTKLDGRYYIGLNKLSLHDYNAALKIADALEKDEYLDTNLPRAEILRGRALIGLRRTDQALSVFESVIKNNSHTMFSAEANYWLGEMYFSVLLNNSQAKTYYDKVSSESSRSPFVPDAKARSSVVTQIIQFRVPNRNIPANQLIDHQLKLAENYLDILNMPDSALAVYDRIPEQRRFFQDRSDSLTAAIHTIEDMPDTVFTHTIDSLTVAKDAANTAWTLAKSQIDSTRIRRKAALSDSIRTYNQWIRNFPVSDSLHISRLDSLKTTQKAMQDEYQQIQALPVDPAILRADSLRIQVANLEQQLTKMEGDRKNRSGLEQLKLDSQHVSAEIRDYDTSYIPFARFIKIWVCVKTIQDTLQARETYVLMQKEYPDNAYTYAAGELLGGRPIQITTPTELQAVADYEQAERLIDVDPHEAARRFEILSAVSIPRIADQATLALGYVRYFQLGDSLTSKTCLDSVLAHNQDPSSEITQYIHSFYEDGHFKHLQHLPYLLQLEYEALHPEAKEADAKKEKAKTPSKPNNKPNSGKDNKPSAPGTNIQPKPGLKGA